MTTRLKAAIEDFPIAGSFTISRGRKTKAETIHVTLTREGVTGHGECVPYAHYGETTATTLNAITALTGPIADGLTRQDLQTALRPGAARNALDCAFWDLEAKLAGKSVAELAGLTLPENIVTAYTISLGTPEEMAAATRAATGYPLLKLKLGGKGDSARLRAVRQAAPNKRLLADANEAWSDKSLGERLRTAADLGLELVEQPLPAKADSALATVAHPLPVCADESAHDLAGLEALAGHYDAINIKLDKTGGLTEALALARAAQQAGLRIMVGCMVGTSLSMAPALMLASFADWVDLDGPLLLQKDRPDGLVYDKGLVRFGDRPIWGSAKA